MAEVDVPSVATNPLVVVATGVYVVPLTTAVVGAVDVMVTFWLPRRTEKVCGNSDAAL
jgi:hypothetical protein